MDSEGSPRKQDEIRKQEISVPFRIGSCPIIKVEGGKSYEQRKKTYYIRSVCREERNP